MPQMKEALENVSNLDEEFNENQSGKLHLLYGGTKIVQHTPPSKTGDGLRPPDGGCVAYGRKRLVCKCRNVFHEICCPFSPTNRVQYISGKTFANDFIRSTASDCK